MSSAASFSSHQIAPDSLASLPRTCGVYVFWGEGKLPLYIGKSVDIRQRVLAHLRADDEVNMVAQARRVDFIETAGELGPCCSKPDLSRRTVPSSISVYDVFETCARFA